MEAKVKVGLWGFGVMNKAMLCYLKSYAVVAVIGRHDVGLDAGEVAGTGRLGVAITPPSEAETTLKRTMPKVMILATQDTLREQEQQLRTCAVNGVSVVSIGCEAFYSWGTDPELTKELDSLFREHGATLTGTGYQDTYWMYMGSLLIGTSLEVSRVICDTQFNLDDYGGVESVGVGMTAEEFMDFYPGSEPAYMRNSNEALVARQNWKRISSTEAYEPIVAETDTFSKCLGKVVPSGRVIGFITKVVTVAETQEGDLITIEANQRALVYSDGDEDRCAWRTEGTPNQQVECKGPDTVALTCTSAVKRIKHLLRWRPGYVPVSEFGPLA